MSEEDKTPGVGMIENLLRGNEVNGEEPAQEVEKGGNGSGVQKKEPPTTIRFLNYFFYGAVGFLAGALGLGQYVIVPAARTWERTETTKLVTEQIKPRRAFSINANYDQHRDVVVTNRAGDLYIFLGGEGGSLTLLEDAQRSRMNSLFERQAAERDELLLDHGKEFGDLEALQGAVRKGSYQRAELIKEGQRYHSCLKRDGVCVSQPVEDGE